MVSRQNDTRRDTIPPYSNNKNRRKMKSSGGFIDVRFLRFYQRFFFLFLVFHLGLEPLEAEGFFALALLQ